ncbi:cytochrome P450 monooxygenase 2 [Microdochium nivale]|nr:cytochrome P450 monooxygenase 2 [Microdochium nivale]
MQSSTGTKSTGFPQIPNQTVEEFDTKALEMIERGRIQYKGKPFTLRTRAYYVTVLSPELGHELRSEPSLSFTHANADFMHSHL